MNKPLNYIKMHFEGKLPLRMAFFVNFALLSNVFAFLLSLILKYFAWDDAWHIKMLIVYSIAFFLIVYMWGIVGVGATLIKNKTKWYTYLTWFVLTASVLRTARFLWLIF